MSRMVLKGAVLASLIAGSGVSSIAAAATPTIATAQLTGSSLVITGANFGTKGSAAPFFYQDYTTRNGEADGDLLIGYANQRSFSSNSYGSSTKVDTGLGRTAGRGALKLDISAGAADYFPHIAINSSNTGRGTLTSQSTDEMYVSYWVKFELVSGTPASGGIQIKSARSGSGGPTTNYYTNYPLYVSSLWPKGDMSGFIGLLQETRDSSNVVSSGEHFDTTSTSAWASGSWNFVEIYQKFNTPGVADGVFRYKVNGVTMNKGIDPSSSSAILVRKSGDSSKHFDYSLLVPGVDIPGYTSNSKYRLLFSEHYVDTTPQHVMLGNASTLAASKGGLLCPPTSWNNGSLTVNAANVPSGYNWVYVTNAAGETNATGFAIGSGGAAPAAAPAAPAGVTATPL